MKTSDELKQPKKPKRKFTAEYKRSAVNLANSPGRTITDVAQSLGVGISLLGKWCKAQKIEGKEAFRGQGNRTEFEAEVSRLKKHIKDLEMDKEILKKAAAYFAKHSV